ncbi:MAG: alpha-amylase/4-alpha-glucanotransferase domain-containing protein [bacterium]
MNTIHLSMVIHFHQPVGNFDRIFEEACNVCYAPFLVMLSDYPEVKMALHYSGCLLEWLEGHRPEILDTITKLVARGQVELMTGGFYEPILAIIPRRDALSQMGLLTEYIRSRFSFRPLGAWNAERIWEPSLPSLLGEAGVEYTIIDENYLKYAGIEEEETYGYYMTEDQGVAVAVFPSNKRLRYLVPFQEMEETTTFLRSVSTEDGDRLIVYGDDGEKFGLWPGTHEWVYGKKWLARFFDALAKAKEWIRLVTPSEYLLSHPALGRVYLPTASYDEMMGWALPPRMGALFEDVLEAVKDEGRQDFYGPFLRGGYWRNFLTKYPEANHMHKRMIYISDRVNRAVGRKGSDSKEADAQRELFRGQCNCPYWHGVFGGLYLGHLRTAIYRHLIRAETLVDEIFHSNKEWLDIDRLDFDCDGREEIIVSTPKMALCVDPEGGMVTEWDYRPRPFNLINTLCRRPEAYHRHILSPSKAKQASEEKILSIHDVINPKEKGLEKMLIYDRYRRGACIDHFLGEGTTLEKFSRCQYEELGNFVDQLYSLDEVERPNPTEGLLIFKRKGRVGQNFVAVTKGIRIRAERTGMEVNYTIANPAQKKINLCFGVECNFSLWNSWLSRRARVFNKISQFDVEGEAEGLRLRLHLSQEAKMWSFPVETISQSESGAERTYQNLALLAHWRVRIGPGQTWTVNILLTVDETSN